MKHTPGPWIFKDEDRDSGSFDIDTPQGFYIAETIPGFGPGEEKANARLIAAAPDLLEALKHCAAVCAGETMSKSGLIKALENARAAIAKATGDQA